MARRMVAAGADLWTTPRAPRITALRCRVASSAPVSTSTCAWPRRRSASIAAAGVLAGQVQVQQQQVGLRQAVVMQQLVQRRGAAHHLHARARRVDQLVQAPERDLVVLGDEDPDRPRRLARQVGGDGSSVFSCRRSSGRASARPASGDSGRNAEQQFGVEPVAARDRQRAAELGDALVQRVRMKGRRGPSGDGAAVVAHAQRDRAVLASWLSAIETWRACVCLRTLFNVSLSRWNIAPASARELGSDSGQWTSTSMPNSSAKRRAWRRTAGTSALSPPRAPVRRPEISSRSEATSALTSSASASTSAARRVLRPGCAAPRIRPRT